MYTAVKIVVHTIPPLELVWARFTIASLVLIGISLVTKQSWKIEKQHWIFIFLIAIIGNVISLLFQETGTLLSTAQMGAIITATTPSFMVIFARLILKERITLNKILSVLLATIGVIIIVGVDLNFDSKLGGISLILAALTWALMSVIVKKVPSHYSQIMITTYSAILAVIMLTPFVLFRFNAQMISHFSDPAVLSGILYLGIISTALGFFLWNKGLQLTNASSGGIFFFLQPVVGVFLGWLILGEQISLYFWIGTIFIFTGVLMSMRKKEFHEELIEQLPNQPLVLEEVPEEVTENI